MDSVFRCVSFKFHGAKITSPILVGMQKMIFEYFWFIGLIVVSVAFSLVASRQISRNTGFGRWQLAAHGAALMSIIISWNGVGAVLLKWYLESFFYADHLLLLLNSGLFIVSGVLVIVLGIPFLTIRSSLWFSGKITKQS